MKIIEAIVCFALALISFAFVAPNFEHVNAYHGIAKSLDEKRILMKKNQVGYGMP